MEGQAKINGLDVFSAYGVVIQSGLKNMERPAELKDAIEYDWEDENGKEYYINPNLKDTDVVLNCVFVAGTMSGLISKKNAFEMMLNQPAFKYIQSLITGSLFRFKYNKISNFEWLGDAESGGAKFNLEITLIRGDYDMPLAGSIYYGPLSEVPTGASDITVLPTIANTVTPINLNTGLNRIFVVALPPGKVINEVYDTTSEEDITSEYFFETFMVGGLLFKVYVMQNLIPYSINHIHQITIIDG